MKSSITTTPPFEDDASAATSESEFRFTQPLYNVSISENSIGKTYVMPNERMGIRLASADSDVDIKFRIVSGDRDKFFKAEERTVGDFCFLLIRTRTSNVDVLNRERKDRYVLEVRATANGHDGKNGAIADATVVVTILDTNDLNPLFYPIEYETTVTEDTPLHRSILRVNAEDADLGRNGEIYYSFAEETDQFAVHPVSGVITLTRPLRYAERAIHELVVVAKDRGALFRSVVGTSRASTAKVTIRVRQVNLYAPEIYVHQLPDIVENSNADIYAIVRVIDRDEGVHGQIASLDIVGGDPAGHFRVRPVGGSRSGEYNIEVLHLLDRETALQGYNLTLRAMDRGVPQRYSYKFVPVHLTDVNDNTPVFSREIYEVKVPETAPVNTPVIRLKVTDADEGRNALVYLEIVGGNEGGEFYVNAETGMLYTAVELDAEKKAFYTLTPEMEVWLDENEPAGTSVVRVTAKDRDSGENAYISYSIDNLKKVPFEIDHFSGIVKTKQVLDYETMKREYLLHFERIDCIGHVPRYVPIGSEIITVSAIDFDAGNIVSYRIVSGNPDGCFALDSASGVLSVACDLSDIKATERIINVTATDGTHFADVNPVHMHLVNAKRNLGSQRNNMPSRNDEYTLIPSRYGENVHAPEFIDFPSEIRVNDGDRDSVFGIDPDTGDLNTIGYLDRERESEYYLNISVFEKSLASFRISETALNGTNVWRANATDVDLGDNARLDRERQEIYELRIRARDNGGKDTDTPPLYSDALVRIREDVPVWTVIAVVDATDPDEGAGGDVEYFLSDAMESEGFFKVDKVSGTTMLVIENQPVGTLVTTVRAKDADPPGGDSKIGYSIRGGDGVGIFSIDDEGK
ncbi:fat-like cadherin-related tumor suppressor-like protein [Lasius niger]|uniref:Fat-like cadherin-related tumor suppressor-like protein n=1 Tax=Lasius niger TaxID=67767 RepID=A0A0J7KXP5_LASNI|nr:fat-like cadherin-related tumor suppressor-like protein [Lasius niger]